MIDHVRARTKEYAESKKLPERRNEAWGFFAASFPAVLIAYPNPNGIDMAPMTCELVCLYVHKADIAYAGRESFACFRKSARNGLICFSIGVVIESGICHKVIKV